MGTQQHIIQKQRLNLKIQGREGAYDVQTRFLDVFKTKVLPVLEAELDTLVGPDQVIRIDKLELDLGKILAGKLDADLPELVRSQLRDSVSTLLHASSHAPQTEIEGLEIMTSAASRIGVLEKFLHTGLLDWEASRVARVPMPALLTELLAAHPEQMRALMLRTLSSGRVRKRLSLQFSFAQVAALIALVRPEMKAFPEAFRVAVVTFLERFSLVDAPSSRKVERLLAEYALVLAAAAALPELAAQILRGLPGAVRPERSDVPVGQAVSPQLVQQAARWVLLRSPQGPAALPQKLAKLPTARLVELLTRISDAATPARWEAILARPIPGLDLAPAQRAPLVREVVAAYLAAEASAPSSTEIFTVVVQKIARTLAAEASAVKLSTTEIIQAIAAVAPSASGQENALEIENSQKKMKATQLEDPEPYQERPAALPDEIYLENAGLVLLNPFFAPFFQDLNWLEGQAFRDETHAAQAVVLMQIIATGHHNWAEEDLPLNKILAGLSPEIPIATDWVPQDDILEKAELLLGSAIHHWEKIGKVSPDQFRETFLLREGRLLRSGEKWQLKVDRKAYDVLLEFLPWSYGIVKLPWMKGLLTVDW